MTNKNVKRNDGFTIIEVLIVLAIAGLIMLIVFLAVPALQRNSRNTTRKSDASSLGSAIAEYVNNNDGALPGGGGGCGTVANCPFIKNWNPGYYTTSNVKYTINASALTGNPDPNNVDKINVETYAGCNGETPTGGTSRSVALVYDVESGSGPVEQCITAN